LAFAVLGLQSGVKPAGLLLLQTGSRTNHRRCYGHKMLAWAADTESVGPAQTAGRHGQ